MDSTSLSKRSRKPIYIFMLFITTQTATFSTQVLYTGKGYRRCDICIVRKYFAHQSFMVIKTSEPDSECTKITIFFNYTYFWNSYSWVLTFVFRIFESSPKIDHFFCKISLIVSKHYSKKDIIKLFLLNCISRSYLITPSNDLLRTKLNKNKSLRFLSEVFFASSLWIFLFGHRFDFTMVNVYLNKCRKIMLAISTEYTVFLRLYSKA